MAVPTANITTDLQKVEILGLADPFPHHLNSTLTRHTCNRNCNHAGWTIEAYASDLINDQLGPRGVIGPGDELSQHSQTVHYPILPKEAKASSRCRALAGSDGPRAGESEGYHAGILATGITRVVFRSDRVRNMCPPVPSSARKTSPGRKCRFCRLRWFRSPIHLIGRSPVAVVVPRAVP